jgi:DNA-binding CsgD family transcriptional regulator
LSEAEAIRLEGQALAYAMGWNETAVGWFSPIWSCAYRGDVDATVALVDQSLARARVQGSGEMARVAYSALALLHMGRGEYRAAFATAVDQGACDVGSMLAEELPTIVEAGVRIGRPDEAREALAQLRRRATASQTDWIRGVTARCTALVSDGADAEDCYRDALGFLETTDVPIELARTHLVYGEWLRREGRRSDSRRELRMAQAAFMDMGALAFANRAASELRATGAKRTPISNANSLTPQEREIAKLAASGLSNKEIGVRLSLSSRTVGTHLYRLFPKLGVRSRAALRDALIRLSDLDRPDDP